MPPQVCKRTPSREVLLVIDATFFGKHIDKFGLISAKDSYILKVISYHFIQTESLGEYQCLQQKIEANSFAIKVIVIDGKRGLFGLFSNTPIQIVSLSPTSHRHPIS